MLASTQAGDRGAHPADLPDQLRTQYLDITQRLTVDVSYRNVDVVQGTEHRPPHTWNRASAGGDETAVRRGCAALQTRTTRLSASSSSQEAVTADAAEDGNPPARDPACPAAAVIFHMVNGYGRHDAADMSRAVRDDRSPPCRRPGQSVSRVPGWVARARRCAPWQTAGHGSWPAGSPHGTIGAMTTRTGGSSDNPPDDTTIAEIEDAGIAPLREAADDTESLVQLLEAYQQAPGETPEDIIDRMPEPERSQATELLTRVTPALSDALRRYRDKGGT